jgi:hypothetical protein
MVTTKDSIEPQYSTLAGAAAAFAIRAHDGQVRTGTQFPYVVHPIGVAHILREYYPDKEELEAAGYLHDVLEDTNVRPIDLFNRFGSRVFYLVNAVTRQKNWRLDDYSHVEDVMRLKAADVIDNVLDTIRGLEKGHDVWSRFSAGRKKTDYWVKIVFMVDDAIPGEPIVDRLDDVVYVAQQWARGERP